ncbi:hypothetical protein DRQ09_06910, partial [candidate division KSB1 bacterium]
MKKLIVITFIILYNCAYFNTFYNARKAFNSAYKMSKNRTSEKISSQEASLYNKAIEKASVILETYKNSRWVDDALLLIGKSFYFKGEYDKATIKFSELAENFPNSKLLPESNYWWGLCLLKLKDYNLAEDKLRQVVESNIDKDYKNEAYIYLSELLIMKKDYKGAIKELRGNLKIVSDKEIKAKIQLKLGQCYFQLKEYDKAEEEFKKIENYNPSYKLRFDGIFYQALALKEKGDNKSAVSIFEKLLKDERNFEEFPRVKLEIAACLRDQELYDEAIKQYNDIAEEYPKTQYSAEAYFRAGEINFKDIFNFKEARNFYLKSNSQKPSKELKKKITDRLKSINKIITLRREILGNNSSKKSKIEPDKKNVIPENINISTSVKPLDEKEKKANGYFRLAEFYLEELNAPDSSISYLEKITKDYKKTKIYPKALFFLAHIYENYKNDETNSDKILNRIVVEHPDSKYYILAAQKLGLKVDTTIDNKDPAKEKFCLAENLLFNEKKKEDAKIVLKEIIKKFPESDYTPKSHYALAWIYENYDFDNKKAIKEYEIITQKYPDTKYAKEAKKKLAFIDNKSKKINKVGSITGNKKVIRSVTSLKE